MTSELLSSHVKIKFQMRHQTRRVNDDDLFKGEKGKQGVTLTYASIRTVKS